MKTILGIDPGASGSISWIQPGNGSANAIPMPETRGDVIAAIKRILDLPADSRVAYIEKINGFIPDGGASQMFNFGASVERVGCILETLGVRIIEVTPQAWQKSLALGKIDRHRANAAMSPEEKKATKQHNARAKTEWKNKLKGLAQRLFPGLTVTLKTSDSLLILDHAMQRENVAPPRLELAAAMPLPPTPSPFPPQDERSPFEV